jgi:large subunit ribosomal protein L13
MAAVKEENSNVVVIDGTNLVLGRLGTQVAKRLLRGDTVKIVNCKDIIILGRKKYLVDRYKEKLHNKVVKQGPYYSRSPADIVRRSMRNMLPYKSSRGVDAFKRLRCFNSIPSILSKTDKLDVAEAKIDENTVFYYTKIGEICKSLGYMK